MAPPIQLRIATLDPRFNQRSDKRKGFSDECAIGTEHPVGDDVRAAVNFSGAALNWERAPLIRERMLEAGRHAKIPVYLIQAENDQSIAPFRDIASEMQRLGLPHRMKIYPPFGKTVTDGHSFGYYGADIWGREVLAFLREALK